MTAVLEDEFRPLSVLSDVPSRVYEDPHQPVGEPPKSRAALLRLPKHAQDAWSAAHDEELRAIGIKNVFGARVSYGDRDSDVPIIHTNMLYTKKSPDHEGRVRLKARLVALGNQEPLDQEERTASPTIIPALIKLMATVGLTRQLAERGSTPPSGPTTLTAFDVATAFLHGDMEDKRTYVRYVDSTGQTVTASLDKPLYGLRVAPLRWHEKFTADVAAFGLRPFSSTHAYTPTTTARSSWACTSTTAFSWRHPRTGTGSSPSCGRDTATTASRHTTCRRVRGSTAVYAGRTSPTHTRSGSTNTRRLRSSWKTLA
jgi:hypothetical protein